MKLCGAMSVCNAVLYGVTLWRGLRYVQNSIANQVRSQTALRSWLNLCNCKMAREFFGLEFGNCPRKGFVKCLANHFFKLGLET